jgi:hypothetical protein
VPAAQEQVGDEAGGAKITTPVSDSSTSAANRRGMLSRNCDSSSRKARPAAAGGAGRELGDDGGDQRQPAGDPQAARK